MKIGRKYRIYPNKNQSKIIDIYHRDYRVAYNWALSWMNFSYFYYKLVRTDDLNFFIKNQIIKCLYKKDKPKNIEKVLNDNSFNIFDFLKNVDLNYYQKNHVLMNLIKMENLELKDSINVCKNYLNDNKLLKIKINKKDNKETLNYKYFELVFLIKNLNYELKIKCPAQARNQAVKSACESYEKFLKGKGQVGFPKFKSYKDPINSYSIQNSPPKTKPDKCQNKIVFKNNYYFLSTVGFNQKSNKPIKINLHRSVDGHIGNTTIIKDNCKHYYVSFSVEDNIEKPDKLKINENNSIGLDWGITNLLTTSNGKIYHNIKQYNNNYLKIDKQILFYQRKLQKIRDRNKNYKFSKSYEKIKLRLAKLLKNKKNMRDDYNHKISHDITKQNVSLIGIEDLHRKGMLKNNKLAKAVSEASGYSLEQKIIYKSDKKGINIQKVDRFYASTQICSNCKQKSKNKIKLGIKKWECDNCQSVNHRDINASKNLKNEAVRIAMGK